MFRKLIKISSPFKESRLSPTRLSCPESGIASCKKMSTVTHPTISYVTAPNESVARHLSRKLVERRLAACVNIIKGVESIYEWEGKVEQESESLLIIKSSSQKSMELAKFVQDNHPYDCPEFVTVQIESGSKAYLEWISGTVTKETMISTDPPTEQES